MNYNATPSTTGGFDVTRSGSDGYYNFSQGLPFYQGRSRIASIPEYLRDPGLLGQDLLMKIEEGKSQFAKVLFEYAAKNGKITKPDVKYRWRVEVMPHPRFYLKTGSTIPAPTAAGGWQNTFTLDSYTRPTQSYPTSTGNPGVVGNIARLQAGDYVLIMWSWLAPGRTGAPVNTENYSHPLPEIGKIISVDYAANSCVVERNWAGAQRTATRTASPATTVVADSAAHTTANIKHKEAFFMLLPNSMKEDEIDQKTYNLTQTWAEGLMQRSVRAWGGGHFADVINRNLGLGSPMARSREQAIKDFYSQMELASIFGEKAEGFDQETGDWWGLTDGLLTNIPAGHNIGLVPMNYGYIRSTSQYAWGSFDIPIFNKILEDKGYFGSSNKIMLCGNESYTAFTTMINYMTQNIPDIKSEWRVEGKRFRSSGGLTVDFIQSDVMSLNGLNNKMIMIDPSAFRLVELQNYPIDIIEIQNENPLKQNGFIHGVYSFMDLNPDAHWVFTIDNALASGVTGATYAANVMGVPAV